MHDYRHVLREPRHVGTRRQVALRKRPLESLAEHPAIMTHATIPAETRQKLGIGDALVRLSVGIEDVDDLRADLQQALGRV